ncbi:MAG: hypothetical protein GXP55_22285 [Deltaproteobacteria bacterium]|nr:hypothetical protein [Deltaproteobacteria bacterium]
MRTLLLVSLSVLCGCHSCDPAPEAEPATPSITHEQAPRTPAYLRLASGLDPVHTLNRWLLLEQAGDAQGVLLAPYLAGDVTLVVPGATPAAHVQELATRFGAEAEPLDVQPSQLLRPSLQQAGAATRVFAAPGDAHAMRILPAHAIVIRLDGPLPGAGETPAEFAWVAVTRTDGGYVRADALTAYEGCVPTAERFLADLPISDGHSHEVRATVSRVRASFGDELQDAFLFASQDRHEDEEEEDEEDEEAEGKHGGAVGLYPTDARCQLAEGFALSFGHVVEQVDVVPGAVDEPSLLSVVLSEGEQELDAKLYRVGTPEPLLERELAAGAAGPWPALSLPSP